MRLFSLIPLLLLVCGFSAPCAAQTLQMADGQVLLAQVEEAYGEGLRIKRLDNGGTLELRWDQLAPDCSRRIQQASSGTWPGGRSGWSAGRSTAQNAVRR